MASQKSPLCFPCPSCGARVEVGCRTAAGVPTSAHAMREALCVACPLAGCRAAAGAFCTGAVPSQGRHHPERLYLARGQTEPLVRKGLQQHLETLFRFLVAHPEEVASAKIFIDVREPSHLPVLLGDDSGNIRLMGQGDLHVSVALASRPKEPAPRSAPPPRPNPRPSCGDLRAAALPRRPGADVLALPGLDTPRALLPAPEDEP